MYKTTLTVLLLSAAALGWQQRARPAVPLDDGTMIIEWVVGGESALKIQGESEHQLDSIRIERADGSSLFDMTRRETFGKGLSGFMVEVSEPTLEKLLANLEEGPYLIRAQTRRGFPALGKAELSFDLPQPPIVVYPRFGSREVPTKGLSVHWKGGRNVKGYYLELEQDENDGLTVMLPADSQSFRVPDGLLKRHKASHLEVAAIGENGNYTIVEIPFTTGF